MRGLECGIPHKASNAPDERDVIRRALVSLIDEQGYAATNLEDLLARAEVDRATFERCFQTLDECFAEVWTEFTQEIAPEVLTVYADAGNWRDGIRAQAWVLCRLTIEDELRARICMVEVNFGGDLVQATRDIVMGGYVELVHLGRHEEERGTGVSRAQAEAAVGAIWERVASHITAGHLDSLVEDVPGLLYSGAPASLDPEVRRAVEGIATVLEGLGHRVEGADIPYGIWPGASIMPRSMAGVREWTGRVPDRSLLDPRVRLSARHGHLMRPLLPIARAAERISRRIVGRIFQRFDVVLAPTTAQSPLRIGACEGLSNWETDKAVVAACPYAWPWNVLGWPGISVPAGFTESGLPIGAQLLGPANSEGRLLAVASQVEAEAPWHRHRPAAIETPMGAG